MFTVVVNIHMPVHPFLLLFVVNIAVVYSLVMIQKPVDRIIILQYDVTTHLDNSKVPALSEVGSAMKCQR